MHDTEEMQFFSAAEFSFTDNNFCNARWDRVHVGDLNADGNEELVCVNHGTGDVHWTTVGDDEIHFYGNYSTFPQES